MEALNVTCESCNKGKVVVIGIWDVDYKIGCDSCNHTFNTHVDGYDAIMDINDYNEQVGDDVRILNENGTWNLIVQFEKDFDLQEYTRNMKHIQSIEDSSKINYYYEFDEKFFNIVRDLHNGKLNINIYKPREESKQKLMAHFGITA